MLQECILKEMGLELPSIKALVVLIFAGRLFQSLGAATEKARSPYVEVKDLGTTRRPCVAERKERVGTYVSSKSLKYSGAQPLMILKVISRTLNIILCSTGSQCSTTMTL